jgi:hypothetical protein
MRTTLVIPDPVYERARQRAREQGCQLSQFVTESLTCRLLEIEAAAAMTKEPLRLPSFSMGVPKVDVADRDALERAMED